MCRGRRMAGEGADQTILILIITPGAVCIPSRLLRIRGHYSAHDLDLGGVYDENVDAVRLNLLFKGKGSGGLLPFRLSKSENVCGA